MQRLNKSVFLLLLFSFSFAFSEVTKEEAYNKLKEKFSNVKSFSLNFSEKNLTGSLKATLGNKFILNIPDRKIVSDGKSLWNYSISEKKVMLSDFENVSSVSNIDNILLHFSTALKPLSLIKEQSSKGTSSYVLILQNTDDKNLKGISEVKIYSQGDFDSFSAIEIKTKGQSKKYNIKNFQINPKLKHSQFNFETPKGVELIDLR